MDGRQLQINSSWRPYSNFRGMSRARDFTALESQPGSGEPQRLWALENATVGLSGTAVRAPEYGRRKLGNIPTKKIAAVKFFDAGRFCWIQKDDAGYDLVADNGKIVEGAFPLGSNPSLSRGKGAVFAMASGSRTYFFDGVDWILSSAPVTPGFGVYAKGRLWVAGLQGKRLEVHASRYQNYSIFPENEDPASASEAKAAFLDLEEVVGGGDEIIGLGVFEGDRLAVFMRSKTVIYKIDSAYGEWAIDNRATMEIGGIGPKAMAQAGQDLLFCSRHGVHRLSRSSDNGLTIQQARLSDEIHDLYHDLLHDTSDMAEISAFYDADEDQLHIFFPRANSGFVRLTATFVGDFEIVNWSSDSFLNSTCGDAHGGDLVVGTEHDGFWTPLERVIEIDEYVDTDDVQRAKMVVTTPLLWLGDMFNEKKTKNLLIHAVGNGSMVVSARNSENDLILSKVIQLSTSDEDDVSVFSVPLVDEYRTSFEYAFRGVSLTFESEDDDRGDLELIGFAIELRKDK